MIDIAALKAMLAAGATAEMIVGAVEEAQAREAALQAERRRKDAERQRRRRDESRGVTRSHAESRGRGKKVSSTKLLPTDACHAESRGRERKGSTPPKETTSSLRSEVAAAAAAADARARDDRTIREEATILAAEVMTILRIEQDFIPPGWCGAPLWFEAGLRAGWKPDIVRIAAQRVARTKRGGPPHTFRYLGPPIAEAHALAAAPIPSASVHPHPSGDSHGQTDQRELSLFRRIVDKPGGLASLAVRRGRRNE